MTTRRDFLKAAAATALTTGVIGKTFAFPVNIHICLISVIWEKNLK